MSLHLHYIDSIAPYLEEILDPLVQKHIDFKLRDTFQIITPDAETAQDIEASLLKDPRLGAVLIGKSILPWKAFWQQLSAAHPKAYPLAPPAMERKALRIALKKLHAKLFLDYPTQNQYLLELKRLSQLHQTLSPLSQKAFFPPLWKEYQTLLNEEYHFWTPERAQQSAWKLLAQNAPSPLDGISELYFLGFETPPGDLLPFLKALEARESLQIYLFLPPPTRLLAGQEVYAALLEQLEGLATTQTHHKALPKAASQVTAYPTPWHEGQALYEKLTRDPEHTCTYVPAHGGTYPYLAQHLNSQIPQSHLSAAGLLEALLKSPDTRMNLKTLFTQLMPRLEELRQSLAKAQQIEALVHLEACFEILQESLLAENYHEEQRLVSEWVEELQGAFLGQKLLPPWLAKEKSSFRFLDRAGLKRQDRLYVANLNEGTFPEVFQKFLFSELKSPLWHQQRKLQFEKFFYLAKEKLNFSYFQYDLSGRLQAPSVFLETSSEATHHDDTFHILARGHHPFFQENLKREQARYPFVPKNLDQGDLTSLKLQKEIQNQVQRRPLSASYLDDYAKCPWKFFARWHLKIDTLPEEDLELEPRFRGQLVHTLLEKIYDSLIKKNFDPLPNEAELQTVLKNALQSLQKEIETEQQAKLSKLLQHEVVRIAEQVTALVRRELENWRQQDLKMLPRYLEWEFGKTQPLTFPAEGGEAVPLAGAIDRIDVNPKQGEFLVWDYKSSGSQQLSQALRERLSFQLFIYLYAVQKILLPKAQPLGALYWDVKQLKNNQGMIYKEAFKPYFKTASLRGAAFLKEQDYEVLKQDLGKALQKVLTNILQGDYRLAPVQCQGSRCPYHEICRYEEQE